MFSASRGKVHCCSAGGVCIIQLRATSQPSFGNRRFHSQHQKVSPYSIPSLIWHSPTTVSPSPESSGLSQGPQGLIQSSKKRTAELHRVEQLAEFMPPMPALASTSAKWIYLVCQDIDGRLTVHKIST